MPETPYCPLLSINKDVPVMCQEELCMWYVKQLKLCCATVLAYTNALNLQGPSSTQPTSKPQPTTATGQQPQVKPGLTNQPKKDEGKGINPFALDDLD